MSKDSFVYVETKSVDLTNAMRIELHNMQRSIQAFFRITKKVLTLSELHKWLSLWRAPTGLRISTGQRQTSWLFNYKPYRGVELGATKPRTIKSSYRLGRGLNPGSADYNFSTLTTRNRCLPLNRNIL